MKKSSKQPRVKSLLKNFLVLGASTVLLVAAWFNRYAIWDWWRLRDYSPHASIVALADETTMNDTTRRLFYAYRPSLETKETFNTFCRSGNKEHSIVLGCFINGRGIHLFDVTDDRLKGIEEVTAAHETLHAAYVRLSSSEKQKVDSMTSKAFAELNNDRIKTTVESYRQQDPTIVANELHSILGTEVANLPADLEDYYKRYFKDRTRIVGLSEQYERNFTERKNQIKTYDAQLAALKQQIEDLEKSLEQSNHELNSDRQRLDSLKQSNQTEVYNSLIPAYNQRVTRYNSDIDKLQKLISEYNAIVPMRNAIVSEEEELVKAIDSRETLPEGR